MNNSLRIRRILLDEALVRARPDSINSPECDHPLHKLPQGGAKGWSKQFDELPKTIIRLELENGIVGLGECYRALPQDTLRAIATALIGSDLNTLNLQDLPIPAGRLYDGFECALVDATARSHELPLYQWLGGKYRDDVAVAYWTGHRTVADAARKAKEAQAAGFRHIKFKCNLQDDVVAWCAAIRDACGDAVSVILDPNERFERAAQAEAIAHGLEPIGNVLYLEDPIPRWDYEQWAYLRGKVRLPLSMHISLPYIEMGQMPYDAARAARLGSSDYFNFNGGIYMFARLTALSDLFNMPYSHGSEIDFGILEASYVHKCAASASATLPSDIFGRLIREHDLLREPLKIANGRVAVPQGPGVGVELDLDALQHYGISHWETA